MISEIKNYIYNQYIDYKYRKIIHKYDKKDFNNDVYDEKQKQLFENGCLFINNFFDEKITENFTDNIIWRGSETSVKKISPTVIKKNSLVHKLLINKDLNNYILNYIGKDAKLDHVEVQRIEKNSENKSISEKWHFDNVGKRLKVFFYLNDCDDIYTEYLNKTNKILHNKYSIKSSRVSEKKLSNHLKNLITFIPRKNSLLIIDTNGYHRGVYRNSNYVENKKSFREMIVIEYSDIKKSEMFYGTSNIIGPRNTYFDKDIDLDEILLEKKYITDFMDFYKYDLNFVKDF